MQPSSIQTVPTNDPFASVHSQNKPFTASSASTDLFSDDPFGASFTNASKNAFGNDTASVVNDPFASDPFGASRFTSTQPASGDPFSSGLVPFSEPNNASTQGNPSFVYDDLNPVPERPVCSAVALPTTSSTDNVVYSSLNSDTNKSMDNVSNGTLDHVYADISKNQMDAFGGPKSLDWFLSQPPEKDKGSSGGKNTVSSEYLDLRADAEYGDLLSEGNYLDLAQDHSDKDHFS